MEQDRTPTVLTHLDELAGQTLTNHEVIVQTIAATTTSTGLTVRAELDEAPYPKGIKIPDEQMNNLTTSGILTRHEFHGEWNYTLHPKARPTTS